jgi:hypothetical protein
MYDMLKEIKKIRGANDGKSRTNAEKVRWMVWYSQTKEYAKKQIYTHCIVIGILSGN